VRGVVDMPGAVGPAVYFLFLYINIGKACAELILTKNAGYFAIVFFLVVAIFSNAIWWIDNREVALNFSGPLWRKLVSIYGAVNASQETDLAFLISSLCIIFVITAIVMIGRRMFKETDIAWIQKILVCRKK
jgi:hypothetical protein